MWKSAYQLLNQTVIFMNGKNSSRLIMNEMNVSKFSIFKNSIVIIFMVIMSVIYCRLSRGHVHLLKRKRSSTHGFFVPWNYKFADMEQKKIERRIYANWAYVGDLLNPVHDTTACHQFALELSLLYLHSCRACVDMAIVILLICFLSYLDCE